MPSLCKATLKGECFLVCVEALNACIRDERGGYLQACNCEAVLDSDILEASNAAQSSNKEHHGDSSETFIFDLCSY